MRPGSCTRNDGRAAFTLVELLVAMALTMFVMMILSQAFVTSLDTFSGLKAIGDMQANLRSAGMILQADLAANHFEGTRRLHDPDLLTQKPRQGFFAVYQGSAWTLNPGAFPSLAGYVNEGIESGFATPTMASPADLQSYRAINHVLYFTVKAVGNRPENVFSAKVPGNSPLLVGPLTNAQANFSNFYGQLPDALYQPPVPSPAPATWMFNSQWAEVCYFLVQTGGTEGPSSGTPLFALYRGQYVLVPNPMYPNANQTPFIPSTSYHNVSCFTKTATALVFNAPEDVTNVGNRVLNATATPYPTKKGEPVPTPPFPPYGCTQVLNNVISFQVQVFTQQPGQPLPPPGPEFTDVGAGFDTASAAYNVLAVKVTLRIWDSASKQSRQITIVQDM